MDKRRQRQIHNFTHRAKELVHLVHSCIGKGDPLPTQLLRCLQHIHCVVADALKVSDHMQQLCRLHPVLITEGAAGQLHKIGSQLVLVFVGALFILPDALGALLVMTVQLPHGVAGGLHGNEPHVHGHLMAPLHSHRRGSHEPLVQSRHAVSSLLVGDNAAGQLLQQPRHRQHQRRAENVKHRVNNGNAHLVDISVQHRNIYQCPYYLKHRQPHNRTDDVEAQMHHRRPPRIAVGADGREHSRNAGADVLAHDDGNCRAEGDLPRRRHRLQDTHRRRGGLDNSRKHRAGHHAQNRIGEHQQQLPESLHVLQASHRSAHGVHAEHQRSKAQKDKARVLLFSVFAHHVKGHADQGHNRRKGAGHEQFYKEIVALDARQAQDPRRHGGTHIRAHNDMDSLAQGHKPRVHEAHYHHRSGRRRLNHRRNAQARQESAQPAACELSQQGLQPAACPLFQSIPHQIHAEQKQAQPSNERQHIKKCHHFLSSYCHIK